MTPDPTRAGAGLRAMILGPTRPRIPEPPSAQARPLATTPSPAGARALLVAVALTGCVPDDYDPGWDPTTSPLAAELVGDWTSEGADLSELFANPPFDYVRVEVSFDEGGGYEVVVLDADGATATLLGTATARTGTDPATIVLSQTHPFTARAEGIWAVDDGVLTYEVVQTVPDYGYDPPTPAAGFGSTTGPNLAPGANVQVYR